MSILRFIQMATLCTWFALMTPAWANNLPGQSLDLNKEVEELGTGTLSFSYPTRDEVRGNGRGVKISMGQGSHQCYFSGNWDEEDEMVQGPALALIKVRRGEIVDLDVRVGKPKSDYETDRDLGAIDPQKVATFLIKQIPLLRESIAEHAMMGAVIARDSEVGEPLLNIVGDRLVDSEIRQDAMFWVAVLASEKALQPIRDFIHEEDEDMELREAAVFALSQMDRSNTLKLLLEIARNEDEPQLQRAAFFALAEYDSPEVIELFEDILMSDSTRR